jgi:heptosyltransferase-1
VSADAKRSPESVLAVRLGAMGDVIHTLPAVAALRNAFPEMRIGWVIEQRWSELLCATGAPLSGPRCALRPLVDFVHVVDTKRWRKSPFSFDTRRQMGTTRRELKDYRYDLAIDFQGAVKSGIVSRFARATLGMQNPRETAAGWFYDRRIVAKGAHVIEQYHSLAEAAAGMPVPVVPAEFPRDDVAEETIARKVDAARRELVLINPGAGWGAKQWPAERYGEVARALANDGLVPLVNFGPGEEDLAKKIEIISDGKARPVSCSIAELIALTRRTRLFIGGDTGPLHLAAALRVPVVAVFGPTDPARNGPYGTKSIVVRNPASRTSLSHTSDPDPGLLNIKPEEVITAARAFLEGSNG